MASKKTIYHAMQSSTRLPYQGGYEDALLERALADTAAVTAFFAEHAKSMSASLRQKAEHDTLFHYRRAKEMPTNSLKTKKLRSARSAVMSSASALRERFNDDEEYVIFKTLVGFESVFGYEWDEGQISADFQAKEAYRKDRADEYLEKVTAATADEWFDRLNEYASIKSEDLAMFPQLGSFIVSVTEKLPAIALTWLDKARGQPLANFTPGMLRGLYAADLEAALHWINTAIDNKDDLNGIAHFIRNATPAAPDLLEKVARVSIAAENDNAVYKILEACAARPNEFGVVLARRLAVETVIYLSKRGQYNWTEPVWVWGTSSRLLVQFDHVERGALFAAIADQPKLDFRAEWILRLSPSRMRRRLSTCSAGD